MRPCTYSLVTSSKVKLFCARIAFKPSGPVKAALLGARTVTLSVPLILSLRPASCMTCASCDRAGFAATACRSVVLHCKHHRRSESTKTQLYSVYILDFCNERHPNKGNTNPAFQALELCATICLILLSASSVIAKNYLIGTQISTISRLSSSEE